MKMPDKPDTWINLWLLLPEPVKAAALSALLGIALAFKSSPDKLTDAMLGIVAGALIVLIAGLGVEAAGLSGGWTYAIAGAVGGFGIDKVKEWFHKWADKRVS